VPTGWPASSTRRTKARSGGGRKLSDSGAKARVHREASDAHLVSIVKVDPKSDLFTYQIDEVALARA
jgi:hypothetical protein